MIIGAIEKQPTETDICGVEFKDRLGVGETLSVPTVTAKNAATGADSTAVVLSGAPTISGTQVLQRYIAGTSEDRHVVQFRVTTSAGNLKEDELALSIREF